MVNDTIVNNIFDENLPFEQKAKAVYEYQYQNNPVYAQWCSIVRKNLSNGSAIENIPFLPISFFKTHKVACGQFEPEYIFESSGTTGSSTSRHYVKQAQLYHKSFIQCFESMYGSVHEYCVIGLLPSYLERKNSSLVVMVNEFIQKSIHPESGFYLYDFEKLHDVLSALESAKQKTLLIGVTFALIDFAEQFPMQLQNTIVMETGGMKGRRKELTRKEVHELLCNRLGLQQVHSEYGMTELLSQAYAGKEGIFHCPPWMKVLVRDEEDPLQIKTEGRGILNIIDLANLYSCSFIATDDVGIIHADGSFEVHGRVDNSDIRGCSLLVT